MQGATAPFISPWPSKLITDVWRGYVVWSSARTCDWNCWFLFLHDAVASISLTFHPVWSGQDFDLGTSRRGQGLPTVPPQHTQSPVCVCLPSLESLKIGFYCSVFLSVRIVYLRATDTEKTRVSLTWNMLEMCSWNIPMQPIEISKTSLK